MNKKTINILLYSLAAIALVVAGFAYYMKELAKKEYERVEAEYAARPELPIEISYRSAILGPGLVAIFKNTGNRHLAVVATFQNPTLKKEENYRLDLAPQSIQEVGHAEGWAFASGDTIKLVHNEYKTKTAKLP